MICCIGQSRHTAASIASPVPGDVFRCVSSGDCLAQHAKTFYFDAEGLLRTHDYAVEVADNFPAAHYVSNYQDVTGFRMPTRRRVFPRQPHNTPARNVVTIAIDLEHIQFA